MRFLENIGRSIGISKKITILGSFPPRTALNDDEFGFSATKNMANGRFQPRCANVKFFQIWSGMLVEIGWIVFQLFVVTTTLKVWNSARNRDLR